MSAPTGVAATIEPPDLDDRARTLDARVVVAWRLAAAVSLVPPFGIASTLAIVLLDGWSRWAIPAALLVAAVVFVVWYPPARFARWRWRLTDLALELSHGVVIRQHEAVPYFRIQQIDIGQGPMDRILKLATLQVTSASASGSATLGGIPEADAPGVRAALLQRAAQAVADHPGDLRDAV